MNGIRHINQAIVITLICALGTVPCSGDDAPRGWRGDGTGIYTKATPPTQWDDKTNIRWKVKVGSAFASPVIAKGKVFIMSEPARLICVDAATGRVLWKKDHTEDDVPAGLKEHVKTDDVESGNAAQTPVVMGDRVYAAYANSVIVCYDLSGKRIWIQALGKESPSNDGRSASPCIAGDILLIHMDVLIAMDRHTGKTLWVCEDATEGYGTPVVTQIGNDAVAITPTGALVRVKDGKFLAALGELDYASPVVVGNTVYTAGMSVMAYTLPKKAEPYEAEETWVEALDGQVYSSAIIHDGLIHVVNDDAMYYVMQAADGEILLEHQLTIPPGVKEGPEDAELYASMSLAGGHLYISNSTGTTLVLKPGRTYTEVSRNKLGTGSGSTPTFSGADMFLRSGDWLYCISNTKK